MAARDRMGARPLGDRALAKVPPFERERLLGAQPGVGEDAHERRVSQRVGTRSLRFLGASVSRIRSNPPLESHAGYASSIGVPRLHRARRSPQSRPKSPRSAPRRASQRRMPIEKTLVCRGGACAAHGALTPELFLTMQVLYRLSYVGLTLRIVAPRGQWSPWHMARVRR